MTIFIPVLLICLNGNCEFMQAKTYYRNEVQCRAVLESQKQHMQNVSRGKIEVLEGTCIEADIKLTSGQTT
jgi:hypothetical protein